MKLSKDLKTVYLFAVIFYSLSILLIGASDTADTPSYLSAWEIISRGHIDIFRTPIYPIYLGLLKIVVGVKYFKLIAVLGQYCLFLLSIYYFHFICLRLSNSYNITFWTTAFYALYPGIFTWCNTIQTESFALSFMVFLAYFLIRLYEKFSLFYTISIAGLTIFLLMLRPAFIYLLPIFVVSYFFLLKTKEKRKQAIAGLFATSIATLVLILYMTAFSQEYGVFASSSVSTYNRWHIAREHGLLNISVINDSALKEDLEIYIRDHGECCEVQYIYPEIREIFKKYDLKTLNDAVNSSALSHPMKNISKIGGRIYQASYLSNLTAYGGGVISTITDIVGLRTNVVYLLLFIYTIVLVLWIIQHKYIPWISLVYYMIGTSNLVVVLIGAQAEWMRLVLPSIPLYLIFFAQLCTLLSSQPLRQLELK